MPRSIDCDYCGDDIEPGTGTMFVRVNGQTVHYCSSKCEKNADLGREARDLEWTEAGRGAPGEVAVQATPETAETEAETAPEEDQAVDENDAGPEPGGPAEDGKPDETEGDATEADETDADATEADESDTDAETEEAQA